MRVAYLVNQYPKISHTFIRREIDALEQQGIEVLRFSLRRASDRLVDPADEREAARTTVILQGGAMGLLIGMLSNFLRQPLRTLAALAQAVRLGRRSERGVLLNLVYFAEACVLRAMLRKTPAVRMHAHFGTNAAAVALLCRALGGPPYSFTIHGPEEFDKPDLLHLRTKIENAAGVFAVSQFGRSQVYRQCGHAHWRKVHVVHCGIDASFLEAAPAPVPAAPKLVSVGRLSEQKGQMLLIEALTELHRRGRDFHLTLVGDGELRPEIERAIAAGGLGAKVTLVGWADEAAVRRHVLAARALVLPSFAEGLPVVIMEALALGRPVVSTYIAGIPELVQPGQNGWLVPAGSVEHLVAAIEEVLAADATRLAAMGESGRARVRERHDMRTIGPRLAALLQELGGS